ncbi:sirohydrochlorin chelatase [Kribbella sp. NBC_01245]|uniref:sirohydrochlorin chelatase n=1 Tax=Kribbella sp. NBC_01245 TaxID=2903578 RepID=UPI002E2DD751|nr:sirohydrochlorin chelatase [Kribbella sp. NBC_01245]
MTAPALVILAHGSRDPRSAATVHAMVDCLRETRDDLRIEAAFLDHCPPSPYQVFEKLGADGVEEIVVVPLLLSDAFHAKVDVPAVIDEARGRYPDLRIIASDVLGYDESLLDVLDRRMRAELRNSRVRELDALVLSCVGSSDHQANAAVSRLARIWGQRHRLPVTAAFITSASPTPAEAVLQWRLEGRRHVAVGAFFLAPGLLPDKAEETARKAGAVAVSRPLGVSNELARLVLLRYGVAGLDLLTLAPAAPRPTLVRTA